MKLLIAGREGAVKAIDTKYRSEEPTNIKQQNKPQAVATERSKNEAEFDQDENRTIQPAIQQAKDKPYHGVDRMIQTEDNVVIARSNGSIELFNSSIPLKIYGSIPNLLNQEALEVLNRASQRRTPLNDSFISLFEFKKNVIGAATRSGMLHVIKIEDSELKLVRSINSLRAPLEFLQLNDYSTENLYVMGYGGEENLVKLVTLSKDYSDLKHVWEAKNVKNDRLDLRVPVWPMALKFLKPYSGAVIDDSKLNHQFIVVTRWGQLGKYRTQHGRKPLSFLELVPNREPLTTLQFLNASSQHGNLDDNDLDGAWRFVTTDTKRNVFKFDSQGHLLSKVGNKEISGAVTTIKSLDKYLLQGGLDRYLRVFESESDKMLIKIYVGFVITDVLLLDDIDEEARLKEVSKQRQQAEEIEERENLWKSLEGHTKKRKLPSK